MATIILPPIPPRPAPAVRPTMSPELETPGNKGVKVIMVQGPGAEPGPQPEPEPFEPLSISRGAKWDDSNIYEVGQIIEARTAVFAGGKEPVSFKYRFQTKEWVNGAWSDTDWVSGPWMETTNEAKVCQWVGMLEETIRFQSWAEDSSDPVNTVPSYTPNKSICEIGTVNATVNGNPYDLVAAPTITVGPLTVNALTIEITGLARVSYNWSVRGNAGVEFSDPTGASTDVTIATAGVVTVQCAIQSEGELKTVDIQFFVV